MRGNSFTISEYNANYKNAFYSLNELWIKEYFTMEPMDIQQLEHPEETYIAPGGAVLFAVDDSRVLGTVALLPLADGAFEMSKMAVAPTAQGRGIGMKLCLYAIEKAKSLGAETLVLYSNTKLATALRLYHRAGFTITQMDHVDFARANIKMEIKLK